MSYDVRFKVKVENCDRWVNVGDCDANITWNVREMIKKSTGLQWSNDADNGLCVDVIPAIEKGFRELTDNREKYKKYESPNGWGTVAGCRGFFERIIDAWKYLMIEDEGLARIAHFWIE